MLQLFNPLSWVSTTHNAKLELIERRARKGASEATDLLFVHGAYAGAWCWDANFLPYFAERGYNAHALSLRGHGRSEGRSWLHCFGINDYMHDLTQVIESFERPPILIGHSMGGLLVQKYLERHETPGAVLMAPVPPQGLAGSAFRLLSSDPLLFAQLSMIQATNPTPENLRAARKAVFSERVSDSEVMQYAQYFQGESQRAVWEMTAGSLPRRWRVQPPPMLVLGAADDALFSTGMVKAAAHAYGVEAEIFPDMAHAMMLEPDWRLAADRIFAWLGSEGF